MTTDFDSQEAAIGMRDVIAAIADKRINTLRPETSYAVVQTINREQRSAQVLYMGDTDPVTVALGSIEPATVGETVRIGGTMGHRYVEDVLGTAIMSGNDERYAEVGHTHAGGGAISLTINDLSDVDTATNPPVASTVLGWNTLRSQWVPISIDLGTAYLPLTGGTVSGPTTFNSSLSVTTTLTVGGAVTGQSFTGIGANLTSLNAAALASGLIPVARFPTTIGSSTTGTAAAWTTGRVLTVSGDMTGTVTIKGDADMTLSVALQPNSIDLGTDTTGNYVAHIIGTANQIISNVVVAGEGTIHTLSLPQSINTTATPSFARVFSTQATGTSPFTVVSTTLVNNLTAQYLGAANQDAAFFQNANNLNLGTVPSARIAGAYTGITGLGTLTGLTVAGTTAFTLTPTVAGNTVWHAGNDGVGSGLDAGLLGGVLPIGYASTELMESLMGDLLSVGLYDAVAYNNDKYSIVFDRATHQSITGLTVAAGDNPLDFRFDVNLPVIPQIDLTVNAARRVILRTVGTFQVSFLRTGDDDYLARTTSAVSTPANASLTLPNIFAVRARVRKTTLNSATERIIARYGSDPGNLAWKLAILNGALILTVSNNGTTLTAVTVLTAAELDAIPGTANDTDFYVAVVVTLNGTNLLARGWGSVDGVLWTTAAVEKSVAFAFTSLYVPTTPMWVGGEAAATAWDGRIYWVDVINDADPNGAGGRIFRFDAANHPFGGAASYQDPNGVTWTASNAAAFVQPFYNIQAVVPLSGGDRTVTTPNFAYTAGVGRPWHLRLTWNPTTDTLAIGHRSGQDLALDVATPAFIETSTAFTGATLTTIGAVTIGEATGPASVNWSYGGLLHRALFSMNAATILDLRNTNLTVVSQTVITPTTGPVMTLSHASMAITTMPKPVWAEGPSVYRHNMYWIVASTDELNFIDSDLSGRYDPTTDKVVTVANGDWIVAIDPQFGALGHEEGANLTLSQVTFQYIPFSTETYVKNQIHAHTGDTLDPHAAAGYLKAATAASLYAPLVHSHGAEIQTYISLHESKTDPHPIYLTQGEADGLYLRPGAAQPYEPVGAVLAHEQKADPHPVYLTSSEGNAAYAVVTHVHNEFAQVGHTHPTDFEVISTDGAQSARVFMGSVIPVGPRIGDLWIQTFDISLQPPAAPTGLVVSATTPTTVTLTWNAWDPTVAQNGVVVERSPNGSTGWVQLTQDLTSPYILTFQDTGLAERTTYFYRIRAANATGQGAYGNISAATTNAPPNAPGTLSVTAVTATGFRLNWAAVTAPANDPLHATPYEVFRNSTSLGFTAALFWDHTGLTENTTYSLGVRARDNILANSATTNINGTTGNAAPPAPTSPSASAVTHNAATLSWGAVTGITDFQVYQTYLNGNYVANVGGTSYNFTGLSPSTAYTLGVRTVDNSNATSAIVTASITTAVNPDTTPPAAVTITSYRPEGSYGRMVVTWNQPEATATTIVYRNVNGAGWEEMYHGGLAAGNGYQVDLRGSSNWAADTTIYCVIHQWDAAGNVTYGSQLAYTLVASPTLFGPHASSSWRAPNGGQWNPAQTKKVYQGYASDPALNSWGFWFYGSDFQNWWAGGRTITSAQIFINREGCGFNQEDMITLYVHNMLEDPGNVAFWGTPSIFGGSDIGTVHHADAKWMDIPTQWMYDCVNGVRRGFAIARSSGKPYVCLYPASQAYSGVVQVNHLG